MLGGSFVSVVRPSSCPLSFMADVCTTSGWMAIGGGSFLTVAQ